MRYPKAFQDLIAEFAALPSIGPKMAERLVLYLFKQPDDKLMHFAESLENLKQLKTCEQCFYITENHLCVFCADDKRQREVLCVVEEPLDVIAIERTGSFGGRYHVLGGVLEGSGDTKEQELHIQELLSRVSQGDIQEVILALNPTTEGDLTALFLKTKLASYPVKVTRIARGMATGGDIEYADELTLSSSLTNRQELR
ncbi:MAG: recombination protein RecR [Candidatus Moraniibacteriota bacterium]|nr:MAG: recombination protein RecR [Candidatus Moranbacteria bacterium]